MNDRPAQRSSSRKFGAIALAHRVIFALLLGCLVVHSSGLNMLIGVLVRNMAEEQPEGSRVDVNTHEVARKCFRSRFVSPPCEGLSQSSSLADGIALVRPSALPARPASLAEPHLTGAGIRIRC